MNHAESYASLLEHFATYFEAVDRGDLDAVMRILEGATLSVAGTELSDPVAIRRVYEARRQAPGADGRLLTKHHVTNLRLDQLEGHPEAVGMLEAAAYYFRLEPGPDGPVVTTTGRLRQEVVRADDTWRVRRHEIVTDFTRDAT